MSHRFLRVRHAPVAIGGICYGQHDVETTLAPIDAAAVIVRQVNRIALSTGAPEIVVTSPWKRTHDVAAVVAQVLGVPLEVDARLSELSFGEWEGRAWSELERDDGARLNAWMAEFSRLAPPGGETLPAMIERVRAVRAAHRDRTAVAITHAGPIRVMRADDRGVDYASIAIERVDHLVVE